MGFFLRSRCRPRRWILKSLIITWRIRQTVNARFKLWISRNRKWGDKNGSSKRETWSSSTNSRLPFDVNVKLILYYYSFFFRYDLNPDPSLISFKHNLASLCEMRGSSKNGNCRPLKLRWSKLTVYPPSLPHFLDNARKVSRFSLPLFQKSIWIVIHFPFSYFQSWALTIRTEISVIAGRI